MCDAFQSRKEFARRANAFLKCRALVRWEAATAVGFAFSRSEPLGRNAEGARNGFGVAATGRIAIRIREVLDGLVLDADEPSQGAPRGRRICLLHGPAEAFGVRVHAVECVIASVQMCLCFAGRSVCRAGRSERLAKKFSAPRNCGFNRGTDEIFL